MVNITLHFEWTYIKYIITAVCVFVCATFLSSASVLESATIGLISGLFSFWIDKASMWPKRFMQKVDSAKKIETKTTPISSSLHEDQKKTD